MTVLYLCIYVIKVKYSKIRLPGLQTSSSTSTSMHRSLTRLKPIFNAMANKTTSTYLLADFSTCEISDALIKLSVPHGGLLPDIHMLSPTTSNSAVRICSPAYTVQMVSSSNKDAPSLSEHFVDTAPADSVVVIDAPPGSVIFMSFSVLRPLMTPF